jgi:hypothetical protein
MAIGLISRLGLLISTFASESNHVPPPRSLSGNGRSDGDPMRGPPAEVVRGLVRLTCCGIGRGDSHWRATHRSSAMVVR